MVKLTLRDRETDFDDITISAVHNKTGQALWEISVIDDIGANIRVYEMSNPRQWLPEYLADLKVGTDLCCMIHDSKAITFDEVKRFVDVTIETLEKVKQPVN